MITKEYIDQKLESLSNQVAEKYTNWFIWIFTAGVFVGFFASSAGYCLAIYWG